MLIATIQKSLLYLPFAINCNAFLESAECLITLNSNNITSRFIEIEITNASCINDRKAA